MYNEKKESIDSQPEYAKVAKAMSKEIISGWAPEEQNSMIRIIRDLVANQRQIEIKETEEKLEYLRGSLNEL